MADTMTREQLIDEAAQNIGIVANGMPLSAEDGARIDAKIDPLFARLSSDGICNVDDDDAIPVVWFSALGRILANICGPAYGIPFSRDAMLIDQLELLKTTAPRPTYEVSGAETI